MSTEVGFLNNEALALIATASNEMEGGNNGKRFMKFSGDTGEYSYGAEKTELPVGTQLVMDPLTLERGWVIWKGGKIAHQVMVKPPSLPPAEGALPFHGPYEDGDGPVQQETIDFATTEEPYVQMVFQANNKSKRMALGTLMKEWGGSYKLHPGKYPVIEIDAKPFQTKAGGRTVTKQAPSFKIVAWISAQEMEAMRSTEGSPSDYEAAESTQVATTPKAETAPVRKKGRF